MTQVDIEARPVRLTIKAGGQRLEIGIKRVRLELRARGARGLPGSFVASYRGEWNDKGITYQAGDLFRWSAPPGSTSGIYLALEQIFTTVGSTPEDFATTLLVADGENGAGAYETALANGFVGTESEWLASLQGDDAEVTAGNIETALGYVPADAAALAAVHQSPTPLAWGGGFKLHPFLGSTSGARQSLQVVQNRLYHQLGRPIGRVRVSNPAVEVNTGQAGSIARAGICEWDAAGNAPGALLVDWGTADCSTSGTKTFSNGAAHADLDPSKAYSMAFVIGGAGTAATLYYQPFAPEAAPKFVLGTSMMILGIYDSGGNSTQRTSGFTNPVALVGSVTAEASANAPGQRNFFICDVMPTP